MLARSLACCDDRIVGQQDCLVCGPRVPALGHVLEAGEVCEHIVMLLNKP